jgi:DNA-binding NtrC family response regulator
MTVRVLVAEDDLNAHKVIRDILEISFRDVTIDRALDHGSAIAKIREADPGYDLVLYDLHFDYPSGLETLAVLRTEQPQLDRNLVVLNGSAEEVASCEATRNLPYILKPFSLDTFSEVIKKVCDSSR